MTSHMQAMIIMWLFSDGGAGEQISSKPKNTKRTKGAGNQYKLCECIDTETNAQLLCTRFCLQHERAPTHQYENAHRVWFGILYWFDVISIDLYSSVLNWIFLCFWHLFAPRFIWIYMKFLSSIKILKKFDGKSGNTRRITVKCYNNK